MASDIAWRIHLRLGFYLSLAAFLVYYLRGTDWRGLEELDLQPTVLLAIVPFSLASRFLQPLAWAVLIRDYGARPPRYPQLTLIHATSWLARYIPGKLAWLGGKVLFGSRYGVDVRVLAITSVAEAGIQMATGLALAFLLFVLAGEVGRVSPRLRFFSVVALCTVSVALLPPVFNAVVARLQALVDRQASTVEHRLSFGAVLSVGTLYLLIHGLGALPLFYLLKLVYVPLTLAHLTYVTAASLLAGAVGALAVFAPSGLGVREGVLIVLLGVVMPKEVTVVAVLLLRLWGIAMDLLFYAMAMILDRARPEILESS